MVEPLRSRVREWVFRFVLLVAALVALWGANRAFEAAQKRAATSLTYSTSGWLAWVGLAVTAGIAVGLAFSPPRGWRPYGWGKAFVVGIVPFILLTHGLLARTRWELPTFLRRFYFYLNPGPQWALAIILGLAVTSGFPRENSTDRIGLA
jgi:hypothetical protein